MTFLSFRRHTRYPTNLDEESLPCQPAEKRLFPHVAVDRGDRFRQWNILGARVHAVLRVGAILYAARAH
jgi:hypothetical protein